MFHFSPSEYHRALLGRTIPRLAFQPGYDVLQWQEAARQKLRGMLRMPPDSERVPLEPVTEKIWHNGLGTIERIVFHSAPYSDVPCYLCIPDQWKMPHCLFFCLQGHSTGMHNSIGVSAEDDQATIEVAGDRDFALGCMRRGIAAFCMEQSAFGERRELVQQKRASTYCHDAFVQSLMLGRTLIGEWLYDMERAAELIAGRPELSGVKLGVVGNSGGGTMAVFAGALMPWLSYAIPSCAFGSFAGSKMRLYHCACGYVPDMLTYFEMDDILGLFAPHPVVIVAGRFDEIIPFESVEESFARVRRIYAALGAEDACRLVVGEGPHRFYAQQAWEEMMPFLGI